MLGLINTSVAYMALNYASSLLIIWSNKWSFQYGFPCSVFLTTVHFFFTFLGLFLCRKSFQLYEKKRNLSIIKVLPISILFSLFVIFNNMSLQKNSVGMAQLLKILTTPCVVILEFYFFNQKPVYKKIISLILICTGVAVCTLTDDISSNLDGLIYGCLGILSASLYQIFIKKELGRLNCTPPQLLEFQSAISSVLLFLFYPIYFLLQSTKTQDHIVQYTQQLQPLSLVWAFISAISAAVVNVSIFAVISKTSPLAYNILGHFKFVSVLLSSFFLFNQPYNAKMLIGVALALSGIVMYTLIANVKKPEVVAKDEGKGYEKVANGNDKEKTEVGDAGVAKEGEKMIGRNSRFVIAANTLTSIMTYLPNFLSRGGVEKRGGTYSKIV